MMLPDLLLVVLLAAIVARMLFSFVKKFKKGENCCGTANVKVKKKRLHKPTGSFTLTVEGMHCENCRRTVTEAVTVTGVDDTANVVHYGYIEKYIERLGEPFNIREIAFDRWGAVQMVQNLEGMYRNGDGVMRDYSAAVEWQERLVDFRQARYEESGAEDEGLDFAHILHNFAHGQHSVPVFSYVCRKRV